jgi:hypothetical protein
VRFRDSAIGFPVHLQTSCYSLYVEASHSYGIIKEPTQPQHFHPAGYDKHTIKLATSQPRWIVGYCYPRECYSDSLRGCAQTCYSLLYKSASTLRPSSLPGGNVCFPSPLLAIAHYLSALFKSFVEPDPPSLTSSTHAAYDSQLVLHYTTWFLVALR